MAKLTPSSTVLYHLNVHDKYNYQLLNFSLYFQLTARLAIGSHGAIAVRLATVGTRQEHGRLSKKNKTEELHARIWRRQRTATLRDAQVLS